MLPSSFFKGDAHISTQPLPRWDFTHCSCQPALDAHFTVLILGARLIGRLQPFAVAARWPESFRSYRKLDVSPTTSHTLGPDAAT